MTTQPMRGVRVVEVAQYTFTPAAGAVLADWGADVIKIEHPERGDAQRGIKVGPVGAFAGSFQPLMEHANRGKRSIGLALDTESGRAVLDDLVAHADVFITNLLPGPRRRLRIDPDDIRAVNPDIIYARGSAHGQRGPDADKGGFDASTFWCRGGGAHGASYSDQPAPAPQPAGAYGDSTGGMILAGGISGALFHRERTGETSIVDISLLSVATWAMGLAMSVSMLTGEEPERQTLDDGGRIVFNPLAGTYRTADDRFVTLMMLQFAQYWPEVCRHLERPDLIDDARFADPDTMLANAEAAGDLVAAEIAAKPLAHWVERFADLSGQWAVVQSPLELSHDPDVRANGFVRPVVDADGNERELVASPIQFDTTDFDLQRGPQFAEHTDEILREIGMDDDAIIALKISGDVT